MATATTTPDPRRIRLVRPLTSDEKKCKQALRSAFKARKMSQNACADELGLSQSAVSYWLSDAVATLPPINTVVWLEERLMLMPGTLMQYYGWQPATTIDGEQRPFPEIDTLAAIEADKRLNDMGRAALSAAYRALIAPPRRRSNGK